MWAIIGGFLNTIITKCITPESGAFLTVALYYSPLKSSLLKVQTYSFSIWKEIPRNPTSQNL